MVTPHTFRGPGPRRRRLAGQRALVGSFGDPALRQLVQEALVHNCDLQLAAARVQQARAQVGVRSLAVLSLHRLSRDGSRATARVSSRQHRPHRDEHDGEQPLLRRALRAAGRWTSGGASGAGRGRAWPSSSPPRTRGAACSSPWCATSPRTTSSCSSPRRELGDRASERQALPGPHDLFQDRLEFGVVSELQTSRAQGGLGSAGGAGCRSSRGRSRPRRTRSAPCSGARRPSRAARRCSRSPSAPTVPAGLPSALSDAPAGPAPPSSRSSRPMPASECPRRTSFPN